MDVLILSGTADSRQVDVVSCFCSLWLLRHARPVTSNFVLSSNWAVMSSIVEPGASVMGIRSTYTWYWRVVVMLQDC